MTNKDIIAEIKLSNGEVGWYDEYTRIYLTIMNPTAYVYAGMNLTQIKRSLASGRIRLVKGSLVKPEPVVPAVPAETAPVETQKKEDAPEVEVPPVIEETAPVIEEVVVEAPKEKKVEEASIVEEPVAEVANVKSARKSRSKK